jgi:hypothetical protein
MQIDYHSHIQLCQLLYDVGHLDVYEVSYIGQSVQNYPNGIVYGPSPQPSHYGIHSNFFPLPLRSLMLSLDSMIGVAKGIILSNISLHSVPPIGFLEIVVHLIPS